MIDMIETDQEIEVLEMIDAIVIVTVQETVVLEMIDVIVIV
jgi:hypothetical protein